MRTLSVPAVPNFIASLEFVVSTVIYSFDPSTNLNAPATLSTVLMSILLLTVIPVVDEWFAHVNVPKAPAPLKVFRLIKLPFTESESPPGLYVKLDPPSITPEAV